MADSGKNNKFGILWLFKPEIVCRHHAWLRQEARLALTVALDRDNQPSALVGRKTNKSIIVSYKTRKGGNLFGRFFSSRKQGCFVLAGLLVKGSFSPCVTGKSFEQICAKYDCWNVLSNAQRKLKLVGNLSEFLFHPFYYNLRHSAASQSIRCESIALQLFCTFVLCNNNSFLSWLFIDGNTPKYKTLKLKPKFELKCFHPP